MLILDHRQSLVGYQIPLIMIRMRLFVELKTLKPEDEMYQHIQRWEMAINTILTAQLTEDKRSEAAQAEVAESVSALIQYLKFSYHRILQPRQLPSLPILG